MAKVFLGGTCCGTVWRQKLIKLLKIDYYNPVVPDWTEECMKEELRQREICDYCLYTITPSMKGVYSIAEVVDDSNKRPEKTILCILEKDIPKKNNYTCQYIKSFTYGQMKSLNQVARMVKENGGQVFYSLEDVADYLNEK